MTQALTFDLAHPWRTHPRETVGLGMLGMAAAIALAGAANSNALLPGQGGAARANAAMPALPDAMAVRPVAPETALQINGQIPFASGPNPAARPFSFAAAGAETRERALECLTSAIYYEAGQESREGQQGVAQVVLNRVRHPAFPASVCGVVYQGSTRTTGCQFTFTCDGSLALAPMRSEWNRARKVAQAALGGAVYAPAGLSTHYHANYVLPYWAASLVKTHVEGAHLFYRWSGNWGRPAAFTQRYAAREADARLLRQAALSVPHDLPSAMTASAADAAKLDKVEGVEMALVGDRVTAKFNLKARAAVEAVKLVPYVDRVSASDNLRQALGGVASEGAEAKPFGPSLVTKEEAENPAS